jgi:tRNA pseudouridine38-40 synthase
MRNILLKLEYDGSDFAGWQVQAAGRTAQGVVKENLERFLRHDVKLTGSGRTDSGVHASAQYANFGTTVSLPTRNIRRKLNSMLPPDIVVLACREVAASFDARRSATSRRYRYVIAERPTALKRRYSWVLGRRLDIDLLREMAHYIVETENFGNFCKTKSLKARNECKIYKATWSRFGGALMFEISANRFLHNMVRLLVGSMVAVCDGKLGIDCFKNMLELKTIQKARYIAPACGLFLTAVSYERGIR